MPVIVELRATRLEAAVVRAQLGSLKMQLQRHFLFNALNSVSSLIEDDPRGAQKVIAGLGELLRASMAEGAGGWTLRRELELLEVYTAVERIRFGEPSSLSKREKIRRKHLRRQNRRSISVIVAINAQLLKRADLRGTA